MNNKGSALLLVLIIMLILSVLGVALLATSLADTTHAVLQQNKIQSNYLARSAVDDIATYIIANKAAPTLGTSNKNLGYGDYTINEITPSNSNKVFYIEATGTANDVSSTVGLTVSRDLPSDLFDHAIYTYSNLNIELMNISGDIASLGTIDYSTNGSNEYDVSQYTAYPGLELNAEYEQFPISNAFYAPAGPEQVVSGTFTINTNTNYKNISVPNGAILKFNTGSNGNVLKVGVINLTTGNSGTVIIEGSGLLQLYVYGKLESKGSYTVSDGAEMELMVYQNAIAEFQTPLSVNDDEDPNKVRIYLDTDALLDLQANGDYNCYILGPEADIKMQSSQTTVNGAIIGNILKGNGNKAMGVVNYKQPDDSWDLIKYAFQKRFYQ